MRYGSLFSGYGGLDWGVQSVLGGSTAWHSEIEAAPSKILAYRWPDVPNHGDITRIDWTQVEPVDVLTGGSPCQDLSHAGKRAGMRAGTRSGLWASMCDAIDAIRPSLVVWENVRGALSACAHSDLEPCPGCVGDGPHDPVLRALGRVLGDLASLRYDAQWVGVRASDAGCCHGRFRVFVFAWPATDTTGDRRHKGWTEPARLQRGPHAPERGDTTPADADRVGHQRPRDTRGRRARPENSSVDAPANTDGHGREGVGRVNPLGRDPHGRGSADIAWGDYEPAIRRWEHLTRPVPPPTEPSRNGAARLSPAFVEWMQGLPAGHVTAVPGLSRNDQLKALGNGCVPQQVALAVRLVLGVNSEVMPTVRPDLCEAI